MPKALIFDVFGTLVDWRGSIADGLRPYIDDAPARFAFADAWRARYQPAMEEVRSGRRPFVRLDTLHRENLDGVIADTGAVIPESERDEVNLLWHRLTAWPDVGEGLVRLGADHILAPQSNGNIRLMLDMARFNGWRWDAILGAETTGYYKPRPEAYKRAAEMLMLAPGEVMMVAAHNGDLGAARACGLATAFIARSTEHGPQQTTDLTPAQDWDFVASDLVDLARQLEG